MKNLNCLFLSLLFTYKVFCQVNISPSTVLLLNQPTKLNCTSTINLPIWTFNGITIAGSFSGPCTILQGGVGLITSVETPNDKTCNLVISSVEMKHAGNYGCADGNSYFTSLIAIVTDSLKCESNSTVTSIYNPVSLKCSATMSYNGNPETQVNWTPTSLTSATTSSPINEYINNISSSTITTQLNPSNPAASIPSYTCSIRLDKYNYVDSCNTPAVNVHFQVCCMQFSIVNANSLECTVSANPPATITLRASNGNILYGCTSTTINQVVCPITQQDVYTCEANTNGNLAGDIDIWGSIYINDGQIKCQSFSVYTLLIGTFFILKTI